MKNEHTSLFSNLFGYKAPDRIVEKAAILTSYSQPHVLQQRMKEEKLTHGDRVRADISPVRFEENFGRMVIYFCPLQSIVVHDIMEDGDGLSLPAEATLHNVNVPSNLAPGLYTMKNVELFSNGTMQVIATSKTELIPV